MEKIITIEEIYSLYDEKFNTWKIILSNKNLLIDFITKIIISIILFIPIILLIHFFPKNDILLISYSIPICFSMGLLLGSSHNKALRKIGFDPQASCFKPTNQKKYFEFKTNTFWKQLCDIKVLKNSQDDINTLTMLIKLTNNELERNKFGGVIKTGVILAVIIPLWDHFLDYIYTKEYMETLDVAWRISLVLFIMSIAYLYAFALITKPLAHGIFNYKSNQYRKVGKILENIKLNIVLRARL